MKVLIRHAQILLSVTLLAVVAYLGLTWAAHQIGFCMAMNGECVGPFYHARHVFAAFCMACVLFFILLNPFWALKDRWKKDVEREEARIHEREKQKAIEDFRKQ